MLSCVNAGFYGATGVAVPLALFYGGLARFMAGIWEFRNQNTFGATAFSSYGVFWAALGFLVFFEGRVGLTETIGGAWGTIDGYVGLATAAAWYTSTAGVIDSTAGKTVLPAG